MSTEFNETQGGSSGAEAARAPDYIDADEAEFAKRLPPKRIRKGWMLGEVVGRERKVAKTGTLDLKLQFAPVDESGEIVKGGRVPMDIYLPVANKGTKQADGSWSGFINPKTGKQHEAPNTTFGCYMTALAMEEEFQRYPKKLRTGVYEDQATGKLLTQEQANALYKEVDRLVQRQTLAWYNDDLALKGKRVYIFVDEEISDQDGKTYSKVTKTRKSAPDDEPVITSDFFVSEEEQ